MLSIDFDSSICVFRVISKISFLQHTAIDDSKNVEKVLRANTIG